MYSILVALVIMILILLRSKISVSTLLVRLLIEAILVALHWHGSPLWLCCFHVRVIELNVLGRA